MNINFSKKDFSDYIFNVLSTIGPEKVLKEGDDNLFILDEDIKRSTHFHEYTIPLKDLLTKNSPFLKDRLNYYSSYEIQEKLTNDIYNKIKDKSTITKTLDKYISDSDIDELYRAFIETLQAKNREYEVTCVTNLLELDDIDSIKIGNVLIEKIDENYCQKLPDSMPHLTEKRSLLSSFFTGLKRPATQTREDFLFKYRGYVSLKTCISGIHINDEQSILFNSATNSIQHAFAYLNLCHQKFHFTQGEFKIKSSDNETFGLGGMSTNSKNYFLIDNEEELSCIAINEPILLSKRKLILDKVTIDNIKDRCSLDNFNKLFSEYDAPDLKEKITRSLDWFLKMQLETDSTDKAINLFVSIESLLSANTDDTVSNTDDMAENIAINYSRNVEIRYATKKQFKKIYRLRNKILHHGLKIPFNDDGINIFSLEIMYIWSLIGILERMDSILMYGKTVSAMREYFEREKLK